MKSSHDHCKILIHKNNGQILSFYSSDKSLFYMINTKNTKPKKVKLIDNVKDYDISMDSRNCIHLVCSKEDGTLNYLRHSNNSWKKKTFKKPSSKSSIDHINVININDSVHIFYTYKNTTGNKPFKAFHLYKHSNQWKYVHLSQIPLSTRVPAYFVDYNSNGDIIFLFKTKFKNKSKFYIKTFKPQSCTWSSSTELKFDKDNLVIKNFLIDTKENMHFLCEDNKSILYLNYNYRKLSNLQNPILIKNILSLGLKTNDEYQLFEVNNILWVSWKSGNSLKYHNSVDFGGSWNDNEKFDIGSIFKVKFVSFKYLDLKLNKSVVTLGTLIGAKTSLLGIDSDFLVQKDIREEESVLYEDISLNDEIDAITDTLDNALFEKEEESVSNFQDDMVDDEDNELNLNALDTDPMGDNLSSFEQVDEDITLVDEKISISNDVTSIVNEDNMSLREEYLEDDDNEAGKQKEAKENTNKSIFDKLKDFLTNS